MDFIERLFGVSPDGGSGSLEAVYFVVIAGSAVMFLWKPIGRAVARYRKPNA